ncbi:MAG TPA: hypothetical protein VNA26_02565, partial [Chitinophagaceae bacterium]|nr:hypothetical protein [Chitinophagaceae bacterium]
NSITMKSNFLIIGGAVLLFTTSCKSKEQKDAKDSLNKIEKTVQENSPAKTDDKEKTNTGSPNIPQDIKNILGEWTLVKRFRDENGNHKIEEEDKKAEIPGVELFMKLNADGTCKFETVMDGTYKIITEEDGRKWIAIQDMQGTQYPPQLYINSVSENELVINVVQGGGSQFDIFKRP